MHSSASRRGRLRSRGVPSGSAALAGALLIGLVACSEEKKATQLVDAGTEAGAPGSLIDPKLSAAVAAAAGTARPDAGPADGPPESGVFGPGQADVAHPAGAAPKLEVFGDGAEPRAGLKLSTEPGARQRTTVTIAVRLGAQSAMPTISFGLLVAADEGKGDKKKEGGDPAAATAAGQPIVARVESASLAPDQPGATSKEVADVVKKLKGSAVRYLMSPSGVAGPVTVELSKGAEPTLAEPLRAMAEVLSAMTPAFPTKPVGVGAYWMVTDRSTSLGVEVIRYRVFRVEKLEQDRPTLSIDLRQYAASASMALAMGPEKMELTVDQFGSQGKGQVTLAGASLVPSIGEMQVRTQAVVSRGPGQPGQPISIQTDVTGKLGDAPARPATP